jgi:hypothetical protein
MKLKSILHESKKEQMMRQLTREEKSGIMDSVSKFNDFGSRVYKTDEIKEMVRAIKEMASGASTLALQETDDWFDGVTVKRDMKEVANSVKLFEKTAHEMSQMQQRLESVYEDMGHKLGKYYDIHEADKGDMDGDGLEEPDEEEYMDSKDDAIKKSMKMETIMNEGASREEKRIVMMAIKKIAKYRSVPLHHAAADVIRAAKELEKTIGT